jgi:[acyl-carrier-protein] S-malonyltransferase
MVAGGATALVECGPGKVLGGLIKRIDRSATTFAIGTVAAFDAALAGAGRG